MREILVIEADKLKIGDRIRVRLSYPRVEIKKIQKNFWIKVSTDEDVIVYAPDTVLWVERSV